MTTRINCTLTVDRCEVADPPLLVTGRNAFYRTARALDALGHGEAHLQAHDEHGCETLRVGPISAAAKWTIRENASRGPELVPYVPFPRDRGPSPDAIDNDDGRDFIPDALAPTEAP